MPAQRDVERSQESQAEVRSSQGAVRWREPAGGSPADRGRATGEPDGKQAAVPAPARQPEPRTQVKTGAGGSEGPLRTSHAYYTFLGPKSL